MKKVLVLMVAAMMATMSVSAQNGYDTKHEVGISYGYMPNSNWLEATIMAMEIDDGLDPVKGGATGSISAEYFYHANEWLGVGGIFSFGRVSTNYNALYDNTPVYTSNNSYFTLLPAVKFNWFRRNHFGMYSKIGLGVMLCNMKAVPVDPTEDVEKEMGVGFNWQVSLLGIEFGGGQLRGFVEGGMGEQGMALAGIRYKF